MNNSILIGRIATDLELRGTDNKVVNFNLAVERYGRKDEVDFIPVTVFGKSAENLVQYQSKGSMIAIQGYIRQENYTTEDGNKRNAFKVIANRVQFLGAKANKSEEYTEYRAIVEDKAIDTVIDDEDIPF